jgi:hypothetical protein
MDRAVDRVVDRWLGSTKTPRGDDVGSLRHVAVTGGSDAGPWAYQWQGESTPQIFVASRLYEARGPRGTTRVRVARCRQPAWGRERERASVFKHQGGPNSRTYHPWTEFVETDVGRFAAVIPNPRRPRTLLREGAALPDCLNPANVARSDSLFRSIQSGSSLRYVVEREDEISMIEYGYWVAMVRHRI